MNVHATTYYLNADTHVEIRPSRTGRTFLEIVNADDAEIYFREDTQADAVNGLPIAAGATRSWGFDSAHGAVPQGALWLRGSSAAPDLQRVIVREA